MTEELVYLGVPLSMIIIALVQLFKEVGFPTKFSGILGVGLGVVSGIIGAIFSKDLSLIFLGLISGLIASGLFSTTKNTIQGIKGE